MDREEKEALEIVGIILIIFLCLFVLGFLLRQKTTQQDCYNEMLNATGVMKTFWHLNKTGYIYCKVDLGEVCVCHYPLGNGVVTFRNESIERDRIIRGE